MIRKRQTSRGEKMPYAVGLTFDAQSTQSIRNIMMDLWNVGYTAYMKGTRAIPHITLAIYDHIELPLFIERLQNLALQRQAFTISFSHVGVFANGKGSVFLGIPVIDDLVEFHKCFHKTFSDFNDTAWDYYKPGRWVPHCTLSLETPDRLIPRVIKKGLKALNSGSVRIESISINQFDPIDYLWSLKLPDSVDPGNI